MGRTMPEPLSNEEVEEARVRLVDGVRVGVLLTLRHGRPFGSHVPFLFGSDWTRAFLHLSRLAQHAQHLAADPRTALFVAETDSPEKNPLALKRLNVMGTAAPLARDTAEYTAAKAAYIARFPLSAPMFGFADFGMWELRLEEAHLVLGFGHAYGARASAPRTWVHQQPETGGRP